KIETIGKSQVTPQMRAEPQLRLAIQVVERLQSAKPERGEVWVVDKASIQIAPVCRQNIHRCALAFVVLVPDLSGQINDRNNDSDSAEHLSDRADHLPVHSSEFNSDLTNPNHQKCNIQNPTPERLFSLGEAPLSYESESKNHMKKFCHRLKKKTGRAESISASIGPLTRRRESRLAAAWPITFSITLSRWGIPR